MSLRITKPRIEEYGFPSRSDTNGPVQVESRNFGFMTERDHSILVAKTKTLISFAVTVKLICKINVKKIRFNLV